MSAFGYHRYPASPILIRRSGEDWRSPDVRVYSDEQMLKVLLRKSPQLLPTYVQGAVIVEELIVPSIGSVDLAMVDPAGNVTLVECKLSSNPEIRRAVIGQIFAYAAGVWQTNYTEFDRAFSARNRGVSLADAISQALTDEANDEWSEEAFRRSLADSLASGKFTLVVAVDEITDELKRVVPYINSHTIPEVQFIALEIGYMRDHDVELIRPTAYGLESVAEKGGSAQRHMWNADAYFVKLREYDEAVRKVIESLVDFSKECHAEFQGGTGSLPSLNVQFRIAGKKKTLWSSYYYGSGPSFDLNFDYIRPLYPPEALRKCAEAISAIRGIDEMYARLEPEFRARPSVPVDPFLLEHGAADKIKAALSELLETAVL